MRCWKHKVNEKIITSVRFEAAWLEANYSIISVPFMSLWPSPQGTLQKNSYVPGLSVGTVTVSMLPESICWCAGHRTLGFRDHLLGGRSGSAAQPNRD